ncbi:MAG: DUF58 domain-containing protein [Actinobacteria bacterium]|nr:DUF58 domain-containing protein [Actinomycetota bacterium]
MTRFTARGLALLAVAVLTYVAARVLGTWELYLIALAFAAMSAVAWVFVYSGSRRLTVRRTATPEEPVAGDLVSFSFRARWGRRMPGLLVSLDGATGSLLDGEGPVVLGIAGADGGDAGEAGPWTARRGVHKLPPFTAVVEDPLGLARARQPAGEPLRLTVVPRLDDLASCAPCGAEGLRRGTGRRLLPTRDAWEFRGIRPHAPGEPLNRVDWKSTAKTGNLMLREMEAAAEDDLTVLLGGAGTCVAGSDDPGFEEAVRVAGSMAAFTLRAGHAVTLLLHDEDWRPVRLVPDMAGRRRLLSLLAGAEPGAPLHLGRSLESIVAGRASATGRHLAVVVLCLDQDLVSALARLRRQGTSISLVHVDAGTRDARPPAVGGALGEEGPMAALATAGVRYVRLRPGDDLRAALTVRPPRAPARAAL